MSTPTKKISGKRTTMYKSPNSNMYESPSSKQRINIEEYSLKPEFKDYLLSCIPILADPQLYSLVIEYCLILNNKKIGDVVNILNDIKAYLDILKNKSIQKMNEIRMNMNMKMNIIEKKHPKTGELFKLFKLSNKIIKTHSITPDGLIETFINCILYYCSNIHNIGSVTNSSLQYSTNNKLYQSMNIAEGMDLGSFVIMLYNSDLEKSEKNKILLSVLQRIATKLQQLQESCGFIHGDLNLGNVFVSFDDKNETIPPEITFIDYGYSSVRLPINSTETFIISAPTEINIRRGTPFDIKIEPHLKAVDMYHLIDDLSCIDNNGKFIDERSYTSFKKFIKDIKDLYILTSTKIPRYEQKVEFLIIQNKIDVNLLVRSILGLTIKDMKY